jgi:hypothetical protein
MKYATISLLLAFAVTVRAQELPFKPIPTVRVQLTDHVTKWYEPLRVEQRTADRRWFASVALSGALTVADAENSLYALRLPNVREANPLFGAHPSRLRYYSIMAPLAVACGYMSYKYKREDDALKAAGIPGHKFVKWHLVNDLNIAAHVVGVAVTLASTGR